MNKIGYLIVTILLSGLIALFVTYGSAQVFHIRDKGQLENIFSFTSLGCFLLWLMLYGHIEGKYKEWKSK